MPAPALHVRKRGHFCGHVGGSWWCIAGELSVGHVGEQSIAPGRRPEQAGEHARRQPAAMPGGFQT